MRKKRIVKPDGRYLILYAFDKDKTPQRPRRTPREKERRKNSG